MPIHNHLRAALAALSLLAASTTHAGTYIVTTTADSGPGSLRQILTDLPSGEANAITFQPGGSGIVVIAAGSNLPPIRGSSMLIDGLYSMGGVAIDGQNAHALFNAGTTPTTIRNITLRNGGGAIDSGCLRSSGSLELDSVTIEGCRSGLDSGNAYGGGLTGSGTLVVRRSVFRDNLAQSGNGGGNQSGGAIYWRMGSVDIEDTLFEGNRVEHGPNFFADGGAITVFQADATIRRTRFIGNSVVAPTPNGSASGGAVYCRRGRCTIDSSYFGGNTSAMNGGAIAMTEGDLELRNVVVMDTLGGYGGAVTVTGFEFPASLTIDNSTFTDNTNATWNGYGAHLDLGGVGLGPGTDTTIVRIANSAFGALQNGPACNLRTGTLTYGGPGYNRVVDSSCDAVLGTDSALATVEELGLGPPVFGSYVEVPQLSPQSVLIDAGHPGAAGGPPGTCMFFDANQRLRPIDGDADGIPRCDIGAQEYVRIVVFADGFED